MLIETHAHLDYPDFANDFEDVLRRATDAGVTRIITIGTSVESSRRAVDLAEKYPNLFAVIGVHPTFAAEAEEDVMTPLRELAKNPRVVAIGETGLDYHYLPSVEAAKQKKVQVFARALQGETEEEIEATIHDGAYKARQASLFQQQLDLAVELERGTAKGLSGEMSESAMAAHRACESVATSLRQATTAFVAMSQSAASK